MPRTINRSADLVLGEFQDFELVVADTDHQTPLLLPVLSGKGYCAFSIYQSGKIGSHDRIELFDFSVGLHTLR